MPRQNLVMGIGMWVLIFVAFYFLLIRPQKKKEKQLREMRNAIDKGDTVVTIGGIVAKVVRVEEHRIILELGPNRTKVPFEKWAIGKVIEKASNDSDKVEVEEKIED